VICSEEMVWVNSLWSQ